MVGNGVLMFVHVTNVPICSGMMNEGEALHMSRMVIFCSGYSLFFLLNFSMILNLKHKIYY